MYAGKIGEKAPVDYLFYHSLHPYLSGLLDSIPSADGSGPERLYSIPGSPPNLIDLPDSCPFAPRCPKVMDVCGKKAPPETVSGTDGGHLVRCWLHAMSTDDIPGSDGHGSQAAASQSAASGGTNGFDVKLGSGEVHHV